MANRTSASQFELMLEYFNKYPQILSGKIDSIFSKGSKDKRWAELTSALNAEGTGPAKSIKDWRKTLKDWKCYVKKKAGRIALQKKQTGGGPPSKEELTVTEEKLLSAIGEVAAHGQNSVAESPICGDTDLDVSSISIDTDVDPQYDIQNYCGNRKAVKRKIKIYLAAEVSEKLIRSQNETNEYQRRMAEVAERKVILVEQLVALLERKVIASENKAAAEKQLMSLKEREIHQKWRNDIHVLRIKRLKFL